VLAVSTAACEVDTAETFAEKLALDEPPGTVTEDGTVTALLLLDKLNAKPPLAADTFMAIVQESDPVPVIEPLVQVNPVRIGIPVPLSATAVELPLDELLVSVSWPAATPARVGVNCTLRVAV
jgi:hypothetical protein